MRQWCLFIVCVLLSTSVLAQQKGRYDGVIQGGSLSTAEEKAVQAILKVNSCTPGDRSSIEAYEQTLHEIGTAGIRNLQTHSNKTIALRAAWEEVAFTVPEQWGEQAFRPDRHKLDWFLGFLEGRAHVQTPKWWAEVLANTVANCRDDFSFSLPEQPQPEFGKRQSLYHNAGFDDVRAPLDTTLKQQGGEVLLRVGRQSVAISEDLFTESRADNVGNGRSNCGLSALITPSRCYIALHISPVMGEYSLYCIDCSSSKVLWRSRGCGGYSGGMGGNGEMWITVTEQNNQVAVFGVDSNSIYIESFRPEDGVKLLRFSSTY